MKPLILLLTLLTTSLATTSPSTQHPLQEENNLQNSGFTTYKSDTSPHSIRIKRQNASLCDTPVDQYTGWLDIGPKHLFFWYFKSSTSTPTPWPPSSSPSTPFPPPSPIAPPPGTEPLTLWLTGGPGGSSMLGMLQELGPCLINRDGNGTYHNPYGWNQETALIFVDQPAGVGFSYVDEGGRGPDDSRGSAVDMDVFLRLFVGRVMREHSGGEVVITGESYGGHYLPTLGAQIISQNLLHSHHTPLNLRSLAIGNGYVSPLDTAYGYWETLCTTNPGVSQPVFNETTCDIMAENLPRCMSVAETCYERPDPAICRAASTVCWEGVIKFYDGEARKGGRSRFDITAPCLLDDLCYLESTYIETYLNLPSTFASLSIPPSITKYHVASQEVEDAFQLTGDLQLTMKPEVVYLLENQVDVLIYQGNLDLACNTAGAKRWTGGLRWKGQAAFGSQELKPWKSNVHGKEVVAGKWKEVNIKMVDGGKKKTRFALVTIDRAGHMVPMDQPDIALDMLNRWIKGEAFG